MATFETSGHADGDLITVELDLLDAIAALDEQVQVRLAASAHRETRIAEAMALVNSSIETAPASVEAP